jgi:hypothetical protein
MEKIGNNDEKFKKGIRKAMSKGVKYLLKYRLNMLEEEKEKKIYDGGVTILMNYMQGKYGIDFNFDNSYDNLVNSAQNYMIDHKKPIFATNRKNNDLFDTNFLRDIYLQKYNQYTLNVYIQKMEKYISTGDGFLTQIIPILDIFNQRSIRYLNVGLALFGLMEKNYQKVMSNKHFLHLKKRISRELADIFNQVNSNSENHYLDHTKSYALLLLYLLEEKKRIDPEEHRKFILTLLRTQNSMGQWIYSDSYDSANEINNNILTIFSIINLLNYYKDITENESEQESNLEMKETVIEGFQGGFLTQNNMDKMFKEYRFCIGPLIEVGTLLLMIAIFIFLMIKIYRRNNI